MRMHQVYKIRREAMGLTQKDVALLANISNATVGKFENGDEVSAVYRDVIMRTIDNELNHLDKATYYRIMLTTNLLSLEGEPVESQIKTLGYMSMYIGKLQLELLNSI